jgi:hypothetical protein
MSGMDLARLERRSRRRRASRRAKSTRLAAAHADPEVTTDRPIGVLGHIERAAPSGLRDAGDIAGRQLNRPQRCRGSWRISSECGVHEAHGMDRHERRQQQRRSRASPQVQSK